MKYLINNSLDPFYNMSFDEWCLEHLPSNDSFFYLWRNSPSVIIGRNQNAAAEVDIAFLDSRGIELVRRTTGGGAVYHDLQNLNYSMIGLHPSPEPIMDALRTLGLEDVSFSGRNDIFVGGRKVSGFARRICRDRELIHGTLMYDVDIDTLTRALDVPGSKLNMKGVSSVRSRVANLRDLLPGISGLGEFRSRLQEILQGDDGQYLLDAFELSSIAASGQRKRVSARWNPRLSL